MSTLSRRWSQIRAIAYYETRMLWRQRMLPVFALSTLALTGVLAIAVRASSGDQVDASFVDSNTIQWITLFWPLLYIQLLILSGVAVVDVMPRDRHWGVSAIIDGTPLTQSAYLLGKIGGAWIAILLSLLAVMAGTGLLGWWLIGPYDVEQYLQVWLAGALPLALLHVGLSLMLAAIMPTRRSAVTIVLLFGLACSMLGSVSGRLTEISLWNLLNPARPYVYDYFWLGWVDGRHRTPLGMDAIWLSVAIGLVQLIGGGIIVWAWRRAREGRS